MEKNKLFAFIFAFCPGAGEMYMGMMKKGMVIMAAFWGLIALASFMHMAFLWFLLPVIWFYSFFDTFNVSELPYERRVAIDSAFLPGIDTKFSSSSLEAFTKRRKNVLGWGGIILGIWMLLEWVAFPIIRLLFKFMGFDSWGFNYGSIPNIFVAVIIIVLGVRLLRKKDSAPPAEDFVEFSGRPYTPPTGFSSQPTQPFAQSVPAAHVYSDAPTAPIYSAEPTAHVAPPVYTAPAYSDAPFAPVAPVYSDAPTEPVVTAYSDAPSAPVAPVYSDAPSVPVVPVYSDAPSAPVAPVYSDAPSVPAAPVYSDAPTEPVAPVYSDAPTAPVVPVYSDAPSAPPADYSYNSPEAL